MGRRTPDSPLRQKVVGLSEQSIAASYLCGTCSSGCPMGRWMDALPHQLIRHLQRGPEDTVRFAVDLCQLLCVRRAMSQVNRRAARHGGAARRESPSRRRAH